MAAISAAADAHPVTRAVNGFYEELPFNAYQAPADAARLIQRGNQVKDAYPAAHTFLQQSRFRRVLEIGCGTGWFANSVAHHYGATVDAVDLCTSALAFATDVSAALGVTSRCRYHHADIFKLDASTLPAEARFPLVNSLGVLHHTFDCRGALEAILPRIEPGGFLHLGLYHSYGRRPFLDLFSEVRDHLSEPPTAAREALEQAAFARYKALYPPAVTDETLLRSWFRDQVLHPHETQHSVEEVYGWLTDAGVACVSTSVTGFEPVTDWDAVFAREKTLADVSYRRNVLEQRYYPGFFVIVAQRPLVP